MEFVASVEFEIWTFVWWKLKWRHHDVISHLICYQILLQVCKRHIKAANKISVWSNIRELWYTVGMLTENYFTQGHQFQLGPSQWANLSNRLVKTASKSVHSFGWNFVHKNSGHTHTHTLTHTHTHTQTNCSENITPPWFRGGVINALSFF